MIAHGLVGDVGGTSARFALLGERGRLGRSVALASADFRDLGSALLAAAAQLGIATTSGMAAAIAVAGPVTGDEVTLTNIDWRFSIAGVRRALHLERLSVLNDLEAVASALPTLGASDLETWWPGRPADAAPRVVVSVGTGLGVGILVRAGERWLALPSEGGHRDLAAVDEREWEIVRSLASRYEHVSAERVLSGPGLVALREALAEIDRRPSGPLDPAAVAAGALGGEDPSSAEACRRFSAWLGAFAGDLVLTLGAYGGLHLAGGVLAGLGQALDREPFLARFRAKGRLAGQVARAPVFRLLASDVALRGAAASLSA